MTEKQIMARFQEVQEISRQRLTGRIQGTIDVTCVKVTLEPVYSLDLVYRPEEMHRNTYNDVHGGITAMMADTMMGYGAAALLGRYVTTTDLSVSYLARMSGDAFNMHIDYNHIGKRLLNATCRFTNPETGKVCAVAQGTFYILGDLGRDFDSDQQFKEND